MKRVCSIFSQILQLVPRDRFEAAVREHQAERHARRFSSGGQLAQAKSLREITEGLQASEGKLRHPGLLEAPARSTLAYANELSDLSNPGTRALPFTWRTAGASACPRILLTSLWIGDEGGDMDVFQIRVYDRSNFGFELDDLAFNQTPEPSTWSMCIVAGKLA